MQPESPPKQQGTSLLRVRSNAAIEAEKRALIEKQRAERARFITGVSTYVEKFFQDAANAKVDVEMQLIEDMAQRKGEYTTAQKADLAAQEEPEVFDNITEVKVAAGNAWISDVVVFQPDDKPWGLQPTPAPKLSPERIKQISQQVMAEFADLQMQGILPRNIQSLPPQEQQKIQALLTNYAGQLREKAERMMNAEAKVRAENMERLIEDQFAEGGFEDAFDDFLEDFTTFRTAFLKGPIVSRLPEVSFMTGPEGMTIPIVSSEIKYTFSAPSPFDMYPARNASNTKDAPIYERTRMQRVELEAMADLPGVNQEQLKLALMDHERGGSTSFQRIDSQRALLEDKRFYFDPVETIEGGEFSGAIRGYMLNEWYGTDEFETCLDYPVSVFRVGRRVIRITFNPDPVGENIYFSASYRRVNGSIWGKSIPFLMRDTQKIVNASVRALVRNMGFASGPMAWLDPEAVPPGETVSSLHPCQILQLHKRADGSTSKPMDFFSVPSNAAELLGVRDKFAAKADDDTGIPPYTYGNSKISGAGRTSSGLSMLMTASARGIKKAIANVDKGVIKPMVKRMWTQNMIYHPDESVKGDVMIVAKGAMSLFVREQVAMRRLDILRMSNNETDMAIFGLEGRSEMWRELFSAVQVPSEGVVPSKEEIALRVKAIAKQNAARQAAEQAQEAGKNKKKLASPKPAVTGADGASKPGPEEAEE